MILLLSRRQKWKMMHKSIVTILGNKLNNFIFLTKRHSALFINGLKATENFVYVIPHVDYKDVRNNKNLKQELQRRKSNTDLLKLENLWIMYEELLTRKSELENKKNEISKQLNNLLKTEPDSSEAHKLKIHITIIKNNINKLKVPLWSAEESAIVEYLKLPNSIHNLTPDTEGRIIFNNLDLPHNNKDHLKIGHEKNLFEFKKNENYYLKGDAALFELGAKFCFSNILKQHKFIQFSNPDFVKSLIIEGCGEDHRNADSTFILHHDEDTEVKVDSRLHLVGGGSLATFMSYYAKNLLYAKVLPLKYFAMGRQYSPSPQIEDNMFHVSQSSVVQVFCVTKSLEQCDEIVNQMIELLKSFYCQLRIHFRIRVLPADKLAQWESLHIALEMYSNSMNSYIEVANLSISGDYISKRLMFMYSENKETKFPHIISGTVLNVPRLLGCFIEQDCSFDIPEAFKIENWSL